MKFKRCPKCAEEIHMTHDGLELDHAPKCPDSMSEQLRFVVIAQYGRHFIYHPDDPRRPYHPISQGAVIDMERNIRRYENDWLKENNKLE